jgi:hypothetical protein
MECWIGGFLSSPIDELLPVMVARGSLDGRYI